MDEITHEKRILIGKAVRNGISLCGMAESEAAKLLGVSRDFMRRFLIGSPTVCARHHNFGKYGKNYPLLVGGAVELIEENIPDRDDGLSPRERLCIRVHGMEEVYELCD